MTIKNESGIRVVGPRILLLPEQVDEKSAGGIIKFTQVEKVREEMAQTEGLVIAIGATAYLEAPFDEMSKPWCREGDRVIFAKYAGLMSKGADGKTYRIVHDRDIVAILEKANG